MIKEMGSAVISKVSESLKPFRAGLEVTSAAGALILRDKTKLMRLSARQKPNMKWRPAFSSKKMPRNGPRAVERTEAVLK